MNRNQQPGIPAVLEGLFGQRGDGDEKKLARVSKIAEDLLNIPKPRRFSVGDVVVLERRIPNIRWHVGEPFVVAVAGIAGLENVKPIPGSGENLEFDTIFGDFIVARPSPVSDSEEGRTYALFTSVSGYFRKANDAELKRFDSGDYTVGDRKALGSECETCDASDSYPLSDTPACQQCAKNEKPEATDSAKDEASAPVDTVGAKDEAAATSPSTDSAETPST